jgi:hypothetical protein
VRFALVLLSRLALLRLFNQKRYQSAALCSEHTFCRGLTKTCFALGVEILEFHWLFQPRTAGVDLPFSKRASDRLKKGGLSTLSRRMGGDSFAHLASDSPYGTPPFMFSHIGLKAGTMKKTIHISEIYTISHHSRTNRAAGMSQKILTFKDSAAEATNPDVIAINQSACLGLVNCRFDEGSEIRPS